MREGYVGFYQVEIIKKNNSCGHSYKRVAKHVKCLCLCMVFLFDCVSIDVVIS